jgi:hypothetical protein
MNTVTQTCKEAPPVDRCTFISRQAHEWLGGRYTIQEWIAGEGEPPAEWRRFQARMRVILGSDARFDPPRPIPYAEQVMLEGETALDAMRWLEEHFDRLTAEIRERGRVLLHKQSKKLVM